MHTLDLLPTPVLVTGPDGHILSLNQSLLALVSGQASDWLDGPMDALFPDRACVLLQTKIWPQLLRQGRVEGVYLLIHDAGHNAIPVLVNCQRHSSNDSGLYFWVFSVLFTPSHFEQDMLACQQEVSPSLPLLTPALGGSALQQVKFLVDLSEHENNKLLLKHQQLQLAQATRLAKLGVWRNERPDVETFDAIKSFWSEEMYGLLGYTEAAVPVPCVAAYFDRVHPQDRPLLRESARKALAEKEPWQIEYRLIWPDASECLVEESGEFIFDAQGGVKTMLGVVRNITEKKKVELSLAMHRDNLEVLVRERTAALSASEQETKSVNRSLHMLSRCNMAIVHAQDEPQLLNELCKHICESGDFLLAWVGLMQPGPASVLVPVAQYGHAGKYLKSIKASWAIEQSTSSGAVLSVIESAKTQLSLKLCKDSASMLWREAGQTKSARSLIALPLLLGEQLLGVLSIHSEHTGVFMPPEVTLLEELTRNIAFGLKTLRERQELDRYQLRLEDLVATRTSELSEAKNTADAANAAKGAFLATMSHELRTPLNAIIGLSGLMVDSNLYPRQRDYANKIQRSGQTLCALIDDILDFSKIETGGVSLVMAPFSLKHLLRTSHEMACINIGDKPIETLIDVASDLPDSLVGDALRLQQILLNLCSNAIKFTHAGEVVFSLHCLALSETDVTLQFSVSDTGIGIPLDKQCSIFDEFTQADSSISRTFGGTGLGLAISARLVSLMGGQLTVRSAPGHGSEFSFAVKLALGPSLPVPFEPDLPQGLRVLIVDDHPLARSILARQCLTFGWQPTAVSSGLEGLAALAQSVTDGAGFDVLLLDWRMPGMDGLEMLQLAQGLPRLDLPLVILMSPAVELEQAARAAAELGLDGLLAKPLVAEVLLDAVVQAYAGEFTALLPALDKPERPLSGLRLLVAEDNLLNQEVIEQVLTQAGASVVLASNGLAAVTALRLKEAPFDAVFMDIQMPVMDGYTATRVIREELGLRDLPIIAVTAHARPDDRERSRQAGMAGHLVKPLNVQDLLGVLAPIRLLGGALPVAMDTAAVLAMFGADEAKCLAFLKKFWAQHGRDGAQLRGLLVAQQTQTALELVHALCGTAGFLNAKALAQVGAALEVALRESAQSQIPALLEALDLALQATHADLLAFENQVGRPRPQTVVMGAE